MSGHIGFGVLTGRIHGGHILPSLSTPSSLPHPLIPGISIQPLCLGFPQACLYITWSAVEASTTRDTLETSAGRSCVPNVKV